VAEANVSLRCKVGLHKWEEAPIPIGWFLYMCDYRRCRRCGRYEARWLANDIPWQRIRSVT
jgi:hypothetical protein